MTLSMNGQDKELANAAIATRSIRMVVPDELEANDEEDNEHVDAR